MSEFNIETVMPQVNNRLSEICKLLPEHWRTTLIMRHSAIPDVSKIVTDDYPLEDVALHLMNTYQR